MTKQEIDNLIKEQILCRIAFTGKNGPYIAPFQYVFLKGKLYFHFTSYGKKISLLQEDKPVSVEIEKYTPDLNQYSFVVLTGKLQIVTDPQEKTQATTQMVQAAQNKKLSTNFLPAHGIPKDAPWSALNEDKNLVIVKLVKMTQLNGLKSP
jgi:nitroimidazol reductase NimA-like FMN-containing flavoprotein (pyridoxamine 5'-phosphate oxidase superfamily)